MGGEAQSAARGRQPTCAGLSDVAESAVYALRRPMSERPIVVLKFGGTSVSTRERWETIAAQVRARLDAGERPVLVCSAVSQISNQLEAAIAACRPGEADHRPILEGIVARHQALAEALEIDLEACAGDLLTDLDRLLLGASLLEEVSPRQHARILSAGELISTRMGARFLQDRGLTAHWLDARTVLRSVEEPDRREVDRFLEARVDDDADPALVDALADAGEVVITQGFIARTPQGATVLLGRGGSDTSAALFAAKLSARRCEIWTDVPGMFTTDPRRVPHARLLMRLGYEEAQELATMGAKVLHPRCLPPLARHGIPLHVRCTPTPELPGTVISQAGGGGPRVHAISTKRGVTLVRMDTVGMWQQVGFLAEVFGCFRARGLSIDLVSTSETNVTVSLDAGMTAHDPLVLAGLLRDLSAYCTARTIGPCASVSLVGRRIRGLLHRLGPAFEAFEEQRVHLVTQAASDLNLSVVVDEGAADKLVETLHALLFEGAADDDELGPSWTSLQQGPSEAVSERRTRWWEAERERLIGLAAEGPRYVLHGPSIDSAARGLLGLQQVERVLFAIKANPHPEVLRRLYAHGVGFECVSTGELDRVFAAVPDVDPDRILFTPNFAHRDEYTDAFARGVRVGLDAVHPLAQWPEVFAGQRIQVRVDPGTGRGHHDHVRTAGAHSKFGIAEADLDRVAELARAHDVTVIGLHAHAGSGILSPGHWAEMAALLARVGQRFPELEHLDLGGGLGVPERPGQAPLDLAALDASLGQIRAAHPKIALWLEPGRYLVALAGVLLARVTQLKTKGSVRYVGVETGMNSLIRPALYGAWHQVVNLSRWGEAPTEVVSVVGPICESADTVGRDRLLPPTHEGDVLLVDVTGAYGRAMSSRYNLREPAEEIVLG